MQPPVQEQGKSNAAITAPPTTQTILPENAASLSISHPSENTGSYRQIQQGDGTLHSVPPEQQCREQLPGGEDGANSLQENDAGKFRQNCAECPASTISASAKDGGTKSGDTSEYANLVVPSVPSSDTVNQKTNNLGELLKQPAPNEETLETCADESGNKNLHASSPPQRKESADDENQDPFNRGAAREEYVGTNQEEQEEKSVPGDSTGGTAVTASGELDTNPDLSEAPPDREAVTSKDRSEETLEETDGAQSGEKPLFVVDRQGDKDEAVESDSNSESGSESDSNDSDNDSAKEVENSRDIHSVDADAIDASTIAEHNAAAEALREMEEEGGEEGPLRTKHEEDADQLHIEHPNVTITANHTLVPVGQISGVMEKAVIVMSEEAMALLKGKPSAPRSEHSMYEATALDVGSVLALEDRTILGAVFETFGQVTAPMYVVRFNSRDEIVELLNAKEGARVFFVKQLSKTVRARDVRSKGYDSSNMFDEEAAGNEDFSDDEAEAAAKRGRKRGRAEVVPDTSNDPNDRVDRQPQRHRLPDNYKRGGRGGRGSRGGRGGRGSRGRFYNTEYHPRHDMNLHAMNHMRGSMPTPYMHGVVPNPAMQGGQFGGMWAPRMQGQGMPWMIGGGAGMGMGGMGMGNVGMGNMGMGTHEMAPQMVYGVMSPQAYNPQAYMSQEMGQWGGHWQGGPMGNPQQSFQVQEQLHGTPNSHAHAQAYHQGAQLSAQQTPLPVQQPPFQLQQQYEQDENVRDRRGYQYIPHGPPQYHQYPPPQ